jgi:hypothetical protein
MKGTAPPVPGVVASQNRFATLTPHDLPTSDITEWPEEDPNVFASPVLEDPATAAQADTLPFRPTSAYTVYGTQPSKDGEAPLTPPATAG